MFIMLDEILDEDGEEIFPILDETGTTVHVAETIDAALAWLSDHGRLDATAGTNSNAMFEEITGAKIKDERWVRQLSGKFLYNDATVDRIPIPPRPEPKVLASFGARQRRRQAERTVHKASRPHPISVDDGWELL